MRPWPLALLLFTSCNAVLDLERARPEPESAPPGPSSNELLSECLVKVASGCACESECVDELNACLLDSDCRNLIARNAACQGAACRNDTEKGVNCFEQLYSEAPTRSTAALALAECLGSCREVRDCDSGGGALASRCERYCGCMRSNCETKFANDQACLSACKSRPADNVGCRTSHCEYAPRRPNEHHCDHAAAADNSLDDKCPQSTGTVGQVCLIGSLPGGPCASDGSQGCCGGARCQGGVCIK